MQCQPSLRILFILHLHIISGIVASSLQNRFCNFQVAFPTWGFLFGKFSSTFLYNIGLWFFRAVAHFECHKNFKGNSLITEIYIIERSKGAEIYILQGTNFTQHIRKCVNHSFKFKTCLRLPTKNKKYAKGKSYNSSFYFF